MPAEALDWTDLDVMKLKGLRVAFTPDCGFAAIDPEVAAIAQDAARAFATELGCTVEMAAPDIGDTQAVFEALVALDTDRAGLRAMAEAKGYSYTGPLARLLATSWSADDFTRAILGRKRVANVMWRFMERFDFLLTPTAAIAAFDLDTEGPEQIAGTVLAGSTWTPFSAFANLTGQPAATVPAGFTRDGRPVGAPDRRAAPRRHRRAACRRRVRGGAAVAPVSAAAGTEGDPLKDMFASSRSSHLILTNETLLIVMLASGDLH